MDISRIASPTLLIDKSKAIDNIQQMAGKAATHGLTLKPHFKTHQSAQVGSWFREMGIDAITVSSVNMARFFADQGWDDITIAFPVNVREIDAIDELAGTVQRLSLFVLDRDTAKVLDEQLTRDVHIYIEIDTGAGRSGLLPDDIDTISSLAEFIQHSERMRFSGCYSHPGHSYNARSKAQILDIHADVLAKMKTLIQKFNGGRCCIGDTPCCSVAEHFTGIDEISPGNFVYYDLMQEQIASCSLKNIAVALAAPVVAKYPHRSEVILHCGAVHLSREAIEWNGQTIFGRPVLLSNSGWTEPDDESFVKALSQEHGVLKCRKRLFQQLQPGDLVGILPVHSCLVANLMDRSMVLQ